jgi:hypothetical protein
LFDGVVELTQNVVWLTKKTYIHDAGAREKRRNGETFKYTCIYILYVNALTNRYLQKKPIIIINKQDIKAL